MKDGTAVFGGRQEIWSLPQVAPLQLPPPSRTMAMVHGAAPVHPAVVMAHTTSTAIVQHQIQWWTCDCGEDENMMKHKICKHCKAPRPAKQGTANEVE